MSSDDNDDIFDQLSASLNRIKPENMPNLAKGQARAISNAILTLAEAASNHEGPGAEATRLVDTMYRSFVEILTKALNDQKRYVAAFSSVKPLVALGADGVAALLEALQNPEPHVRRSAIHGLSKLETLPSNAIAQLHRLLAVETDSTNRALAGTVLLRHENAIHE